MNLEWSYPAYVNDIDFIKLEATSACDEIAFEFETLTTICGDGNWGLISNENGNTETISVSPNPIQKNILSFTFYLDERKTVSFNILALDGAVIDSENLGSLQKGSYTYSKKISTTPTPFYFLQLYKGEQVETIKFLHYD